MSVLVQLKFTNLCIILIHNRSQIAFLELIKLSAIINGFMLVLLFYPLFLHILLREKKVGTRIYYIEKK